MSKRKIVYRCEFTLAVTGMPSGNYYTRSEGGIEDFKDGFWINDDAKLTKGSDARYWIPPHAIRYIAKDVVLK